MNMSFFVQPALSQVRQAEHFLFILSYLQARIYPCAFWGAPDIRALNNLKL